MTKREGNRLESYIQSHKERGGYHLLGDAPTRYQNEAGWIDYRIGEYIIFAHRENRYTADSMPDCLHLHDYSELLFWISGDVQYILGDRAVMPSGGTVVSFPRETLHTSRCLSDSVYERYVFYFRTSAFSFSEKESGITEFLEKLSPGFSLVLSGERKEEVLRLLRRIEKRLKRGGPAAELAAYSATVELFLTLAQKQGSEENEWEAGEYLPENIRAVRNYLESEYPFISSVSQVAEHFHYSREYLTRLFRRYYNLSPGVYLEEIRIREAKRRLSAGEGITDTCFAVGYRSLSAFSEAFRRVYHLPPSAFKHRKGE